MSDTGQLNSSARRESSRAVVTRQEFLASMAREDYEFLPAALEILETPPSPIATSLIKAICAIVIATLAAAYFGRIEIVATAPGKIQPIGRTKVVQPLQTARVRAVNVVNGQHVRTGDVLVQLDNVEEVADQTSMRDALASWVAEVVRREAIITAAREGNFDAPRLPAFPDIVPESIRNRELQVFDSDLKQLATVRRGLLAQQKQKEAEVARLSEMVKTQAALVGTLGERVNMRSLLYAKSSGSKASLIDATQSMQVEQTTLADLQGQLASQIASADVLKTQLAKATDDFVAENTTKLNEASRQVDDLTQRLAKASSRTQGTQIVSPIDGTVADLAVTTVGQVVGAGMEMMRIVPNDGQLEIEALVQNRDIGFINPGQSVVVKIDSFPFTRYGYIEGVVKEVSMDALPAQKASQNAGDPTHMTQSSGDIQPVANLVYPITIEMKKTVIDVDGKNIPLLPGMTVSAEIETGTRRVIDYLLSPLVETGSRAGTER